VHTLGRLLHEDALQAAAQVLQNDVTKTLIALNEKKYKLSRDGVPVQYRTTDKTALVPCWISDWPCAIRNQPSGAIARACKAILLSSGLEQEAYLRYASLANQSTTFLATFRAIARKYPHKPESDILRDLVASTTGTEGKWFAAAKGAGLYDEAIALVAYSPADPRTLTRVARELAGSQPTFALQCGQAALRWMAHGHGYEITGGDVLDAWNATSQAARAAGADEKVLKMQVADWVAQDNAHARFMRAVLQQCLQASAFAPANPVPTWVGGHSNRPCCGTD
jgi:hypothetical protein